MRETKVREVYTNVHDIDPAADTAYAGTRTLGALASHNSIEPIFHPALADQPWPNV